MKKKKLAIISTHPIQYYAPLFRALAESSMVHPKVFFTWEQAKTGAIPDAGFGVKIEWDVPLLDGYEYEFVPNVAKDPGPDRFWGIRNPTLMRTLRAWNPAAVLVFGWNLASHLQVLRQFKGRVPVFFRGDSTLLDAQPALRGLARKLFLSWVYSHIDVAIAVGQNNRDYFTCHGVPEKRVAFAPHAIDAKRFSNGSDCDERAAAWRRELGIAEEEIAFLYAGKTLAKKDPLLLLESFLHGDMQAERVSAHLIFCGSGELDAALRARARDNPRVHFLPFQNQRTMPAVYRLGDVFVLPSRGPGETWGLALNEAMACGRPVIASTKVGAARDLIDEGINGWIFESGNIADLTRVLVGVLRLVPDVLRSSMRDEARKTSSKWSVEAAACRIAETVEKFA